MSKIYDALRKASQEEGRGRAPAPAPAPVPFEGRPRMEPDPVVVSPPPASPPPAGRDDFLREGSEEELPPLSGAFARELANLRASLEQILPDLPQRTILVAGTVPGEGSSTVAARLAQFLSEDPRLRVALVDADLRNADPRPVELVPVGEGFASVLGGSLRPADALRPASLGGLDVLPSEGVSSDPYALCTDEHVNVFLDYLRGQYHYALLDAAPVLSAPETAVLAGSVDGVVLVVRAGKTKREVVQRGLDRLRKYNARVLGVVMNRQQYIIPEFIYRRL